MGAPDLEVTAQYAPDLRVDRSRGYWRASKLHVEVGDLDLASWFHLKGVAVVGVTTNGREFLVTFYDPDDQDQIKDLATEWLNSEACRFSASLRQLKKVCISAPRQQHRRPPHRP